MSLKFDMEYAPRCPACGSPIDYCQGHGSDDLDAHEIFLMHDEDDHTRCHDEAECE